MATDRSDIAVRWEWAEEVPPDADLSLNLPPEGMPIDASSLSLFAKRDPSLASSALSRSTLKYFDEIDRSAFSDPDWKILIQAIGIAEAEAIAHVLKTGDCLWTDDAVSGGLAFSFTG